MPTTTERAVAILTHLDAAAPVAAKDDAPTVADLLAQSRAAHLVYRRSLRHRANGAIVEGNPVAASEALAQSARLRAQAEIADPEHVDAAWADDLAKGYPHIALVEFYGDEIKTSVPVKAGGFSVMVDAEAAK
jgi:hypothetical protein